MGDFVPVFRRGCENIGQLLPIDVYGLPEIKTYLCIAPIILWEMWLFIHAISSDFVSSRKSIYVYCISLSLYLSLSLSLYIYIYIYTHDLRNCKLGLLILNIKGSTERVTSFSDIASSVSCNGSYTRYKALIMPYEIEVGIKSIANWSVSDVLTHRIQTTA